MTRSIRQLSLRDRILLSFYPITMLLNLGLMYELQFLDGIDVPYRLLVILPTIPLFAHLVKMEYKPIDSLISFWIVYNLLGIILYIIKGLPFSMFFVIFWSYIFPIFFFFYGRSSTVRLYDVFLVSSLFCFILGFYYYFSGDPVYLNYLVRVQDNTWYSDNNLSDSIILQYTRFGSFLGDSYAISYLSVPALCISLSYLFKENVSRKWLCYVSAIVCIIAAVLCLQRVAIIYTIVVLLVYSICGWFNDNKSILIMFSIILGICLLSLTFFSMNDRFVDISILFNQRFEDGVSVSGVFEGEGRLAQYQRVLSDWNNIILGNGPGTTSGYAGSKGFTVVCDGEFVRVLVEYGIIGFILFFTFIIRSVKKAFKNKSYYICEILIIFYFLAAGLISNSLSINHLYAPIFWFCIGKIWNESYENKITQNV